MLRKYPGQNKMIVTDKKYVLYCPDGHGTFAVSQFPDGIPKCPVCNRVLHKMEGVVQK